MSNNVKFIFVLFLVTISGLRHDAGSDYISYVQIYNIESYQDGLEPLFVFLCKLFNYFGFGYQSFFLFCSCLTIFPVSYVLNKLYPKYFFVGMTLYLVSFVFFEAWNTVRQGVAISFVVLASYFVILYRHKTLYTLKSIILFTLCLFVAFGFHKSVLFILPVLLVILLKTNARWPLVALGCFLFISLSAGQYLSAYFNILPKIIGFEDSKYWDEIEQRGVSSGLYQIYLNISAICVLLYIKCIRITSCSSLFIFIWSKLYLSAIFLYNFFVNFYIGLRFYWYFYIFIIFLIPELFKLSSRRRLILNIIYISLFVLLSMYSIKSLESESYTNVSLRIDNL